MEYTKDSLKNTWGIVESKEHAEFIIELAELHGLGFYDDDDSRMFFTFNEDSRLFFYSAEDDLNKSRCRKITIPLPPKAKEWPQVGDEIVTRGGGNGILMISKPDKDNMVVCDFYGEYALVYFDELQKPKSKQDLLIEDLHQKLSTNNCKDYYLLACDIVQGKIKGLSYNT